jgi:SAM-dependent methyltransferase
MTSNTCYESYCNYLLGRSKIGLAYRRRWLYPRLCRYLKGRTLDIGCGIGDLLSYRKDTVGADINPEIIKWCKTRGLDVHFMPIDKLPFGRNSFDSAIMDNVLEHIEKPKEILQETNRVLSDGGIFIVGVPSLKGFKNDSDHKVYYSKEKLVETVSGYGFMLKRQFSMPIKSPWLELILKQYCNYGVFKKIGCVK